MFFNNNPIGISLPNQNNLFDNQANNNNNNNYNNNPGKGLDTGYLDYYDPSNPNFQSNVNNNFNPNANTNQKNPEMNYNINPNINQIPNGNPTNTFINNYENNNNNNNSVSPNKNLQQNSIIGSNPIDSEHLKKKTLMQGIQQQLQNNKNSKMQELLKKRMEDQKYLADMNNYNPFGRNGAGAPLRDNSGKVITKRKALISDNKMLNDSHGNINNDLFTTGNPISISETMNMNNIISNITQKISAYGTDNIGVSNVPRYNSARVAVYFFNSYTYLIFFSNSKKNII